MQSTTTRPGAGIKTGIIAGMTSAADAPAPSRVRWSLVALLAVLSAFDAMAIDMYLPAFPAIRGELRITDAAVQASLAVFLGGLAVGQLAYGPLLDRFGRRAPVLAGSALFVVGSVLAASADGLTALLAGRLLQALGAAAGVVAPRAIITDTHDEAQSARLFSLMMQVFMVAPVAAPLLGAWLVQHGWWRGIFWLLGVFGLGSLLWCWHALPETLPRAQRQRQDLGLIIRGYARLLANRPYLLNTLAGAFLLGSLFGYISGAPFVLIDGFGLSPQAFGAVFAGNAVALIVAGRINDHLLARLGAARLLGAALWLHAAAALALLAVVLLLPPAAAKLPFIAALALVVGSLGLTFGNATALTMDCARDQVGYAAAMMGVLQYALGALSGLALAPLGRAVGGGPAEALALTLLACSALALALRAGAVALDRSRQGMAASAP